MRYTHIAFDIDGTLLDTAYTDLLGLRKALKEVTGREESMDALWQFLGMPSVEILQSVGIQDPECIQTIIPLWTEYRKKRADTVRLFPGVRETIRALREAGISTGIVTSKNARGYASDFVPYGIADWFDPVVLSDDTQRHKPYPDPLIAFMRKTGAQAEELLYVGDSVYDSRCAREAGVDFALAIWGSCCPEKISAQHRLEKPQDLLTVLGVMERV